MTHRSPRLLRRALLRLTALALLLGLGAGCASRGPHPPAGRTSPRAAVAAEATRAAALTAAGGCVPGNMEACQALYARGIEATMYPQVAGIETDLAALLTSTPGLVWNDRGQVLMATWTKWRYYVDGDPPRPKYQPGESFALFGDTWFTTAPFAQEVCRRVFPFGMDWVDLRLRQLIGLPPNDDKNAFLQVWVDPATIFRPCPDPGIFDRECQLDVPVEGGATPAKGPPWAFCADPEQTQVSAAFVTVAPAHLEWICDNWCTSYCNDTGYPCTCTEPRLETPYPWTAVGYTYDWGRPDAPQGPSEYLVGGGAEVAFDSVQRTETYCRP